jgi:hypothetical protein
LHAEQKNAEQRLQDGLAAPPSRLPVASSGSQLAQNDSRQALHARVLVLQAGQVCMQPPQRHAPDTALQRRHSISPQSQSINSTPHAPPSHVYEQLRQSRTRWQSAHDSLSQSGRSQNNKSQHFPQTYTPQKEQVPSSSSHAPHFAVAQPAHAGRGPPQPARWQCDSPQPSAGHTRPPQDGPHTEAPQETHVGSASELHLLQRQQIAPVSIRLLPRWVPPALTFAKEGRPPTAHFF